jgi:hypothetical protein
VTTEAIRSLKLDNGRKNSYPVVPVGTTSCCCRNQYRQIAGFSGGAVLFPEPNFLPPKKS